MKKYILSLILTLTINFCFAGDGEGSGTTQSNNQDDYIMSGFNEKCKIVLLKTGSDGSSGVESKNSTLFVRVLVCDEISR